MAAQSIYAGAQLDPELPSLKEDTKVSIPLQSTGSRNTRAALSNRSNNYPTPPKLLMRWIAWLAGRMIVSVSASTAAGSILEPTQLAPAPDWSSSPKRHGLRYPESGWPEHVGTSDWVQLAPKNEADTALPIAFRRQ